DIGAKFDIYPVLVNKLSLDTIQQYRGRTKSFEFDQGVELDNLDGKQHKTFTGITVTLVEDRSLAPAASDRSAGAVSP
ncbi:unnamed protein product, partial [marine sediment metagenome]